MKSHVFPALVALPWLLQPLCAALVTPTQIFNTGNDFYPRGNLIDDSGLNVSVDEHSLAGQFNAWVSNASGTDYFDAGPAISILLDLGSIQDNIDALVYWGYVLDINRTAEGNEAKTFRLTFSEGQTILASDPVETVSATRPTGQVRRTLHFATSHRARYIQLEILANYPELSGGDRVGLGEIKFLTNGITTVTNNEDSGAGSLRQAIADSQVGGAVVFDQALNARTIRLQSELLISKHLTIDASALSAGVTISGGSNGDFTEDAGENRCFRITDGSGFDKAVHFRNLTIRDGVTRGANVYNSENLTLTECRILNGRAFGSGSDSRGAGIDIESGSLEMTDCTVSGNRTNGFDGTGGGIYVQKGRTTITRSTISGNSTSGPAADGGGLYLQSEASDPPPIVERCTFSGNQASGSGAGAIFNAASGALYTHCTIVGNSAPNGAGILEGASSTFTANIVRDNSGANDLALGPNSPSGFSSGGGNVIGVRGSGVTAFSTEIIVAPLNLARLGDYGGLTETMPPLPGSPAIGRVGAFHSPTDQRGFPMNSTPDAGAAESGTLFLVNTTTDENNGTGNLSLREAVADSLADGKPGNFITFDPTIFTEGNSTITLGGTQIDIPAPNSLTIYAGNLPSGITIDANHQSRIFYTGQSAAPPTPSHATIHGLTLINGASDGGGGILNQFNSLSVSHSSFLDNSALLGGGIYNFAGGNTTLSISRCSFLDNVAHFDAGAVYNDGSSGNATLSVSHSSFLNNSANDSANDSGGAILSFGPSDTTIFSLSDSIFAHNSTTSSGPDIDGRFGTTVPSGKNLISNLSKSGLTAGENVIVVTDPHLAPRGDYGGPAETRPPLPGSPAIDAASGPLAATDLRGFPIVGNPDIGAVEYQDTPDIIRFWNLDPDADGSPFGVELALGTDNLTPDPLNPQNLTLGADPVGNPDLLFGFNSAAPPGTLWIISRSTDLSPGSFQEIFRYDGTGTTPPAPNGDVFFELFGDSIAVTDRMPPPIKAFYRFEAISPAP